jgi:phosphatidylinositol alpha-1,6-mannosyltransferase
LILEHLSMAPLGLVARALRPRRRVYTLIYGIEAWRPVHPLTRVGLLACSAIWSISSFTTSAFIRENGFRGRCHHLPLTVPLELVGVSHDEYEYRTRTVERPVPHLLTVSRIDSGDAYKGIEHVIAAMAVLPPSLHGTHLTVVGEGNDSGRLQVLAHDYGVADIVSFTGPLTEPELRSEYRRADMFVLPSSREGFGLAHIEAAAWGLPVISAESGATPETLARIAGKRIVYGDPTAIADAIEKVWAAPREAAAPDPPGYVDFVNRVSSLLS